MKKNTCICLPDGYNENRRSSKPAVHISEDLKH